MTVAAVAKLAAFWAIWNAQAEPRPEPDAWRVVNRPCLHVGVRPHTDGDGIAVTVQVSVCE